MSSTSRPFVRHLANLHLATVCSRNRTKIRESSTSTDNFRSKWAIQSPENGENSGRERKGSIFHRSESVVAGTMGAGFVDVVHRVIRHRRPNSAGPRQRSIGFHLGAACNEPNPLIELRRNAPTTEPLQDYNTRITVDEQCGDRSHTFGHARILIGLMSDS